VEVTVMASSHSPKQNHLLAALPAEDYAHLLPHLELISMPFGRALYESGGGVGLILLILVILLVLGKI
jgi:hypothetical protein